jgi:hypothetical protein
MDWDTLVAGHVTRTGTHADVDAQAEFNQDVKQAAATTLATTEPDMGLNPLDKANPWAGFDNCIDQVAAQCVSALTPKWSAKFAGFGVYVWDQCYAMSKGYASSRIRQGRRHELTRVVPQEELMEATCPRSGIDGPTSPEDDAPVNLGPCRCSRSISESSRSLRDPVGADGRCPLRPSA